MKSIRGTMASPSLSSRVFKIQILNIQIYDTTTSDENECFILPRVWRMSRPSIPQHYVRLSHHSRGEDEESVIDDPIVAMCARSSGLCSF